MKWLLAAGMLLLPWMATYGGSLAALKIKMDTVRRQGALLGFAAGVMIAASVWSLVIPAFESFVTAGRQWQGAAVVTAGFLLGCLGMLLLDRVVPHPHREDDRPEGRSSRLSRPMLLVMAVALHNIPEGLALGVVITAALGDSALSWTQALVFGAGLALQNLPEGLAVVLPMAQAGMPRKRCHRLGLLASLAEPVSALAGLLAASLLSMLGGVILPLMLSVAAGAMVFITVEELIPASQAGRTGHAPTYGFLLGFWSMALMGILGAG